MEALRGPQDSVADMVREFRARRDLVMRCLDEIPTLNCSRPQGAFYLFPTFDHDMSSVDMAAYLLEEAHVAVTPGSVFGPSGEGHLRISYACSREDIVEGMGRIRDALGCCEAGYRAEGENASTILRREHVRYASSDGIDGPAAGAGERAFFNIVPIHPRRR